MIKMILYRASCYILAACLFNGCLSTYSNYGIVGTPVVSADERLLVAIVAENEASTHQENGGFVQTNYRTGYWLKQYDMQSGKLLKKILLTAAAENQQGAVTSFGSAGNYLWLHANGLMAFDLGTLEEVTNEEALAAGNQLSRNVFPIGSRLFTPNLEKGYIDFVSGNGIAYRLMVHQKKLGLKPATAAEKPAKATLLFQVEKDGWFGVRCDTFDHALFALAKDSSMVASCVPADPDIAPVAYRMQLFKADFSTRPLGQHQSIQVKNINRHGSGNWLNPCFARDLFTQHAIRLTQPNALLVIHQDLPGSDAQSQLACINTAGETIWESPLKMSMKMSNCFLHGNYFVVTGNTRYMFAPHVGWDALRIVHTGTGKLLQLPLAD